MTETKPKAKHISKRDSISKIKARIKDIEQEISRLRSQQQGLEKALSILLGEGP